MSAAPLAGVQVLEVASHVDVHFQATNRGKRSVGVDVKHPTGRRLLSLLVEADKAIL